MLPIALLLSFLVIVPPVTDEARLVATWTGETSSGQFGASVSDAGDCNNDGFADVIVGAPHDQTATVYNGQKKTVIHVFESSEEDDLFGWSVTGAGDCNGDGFSEVAVGAPAHENNTGKVYVFNGKTGELLHEFTGDEEGDLFGWSISDAGDSNGDSFDDLLVGAPGVDDKKLGADAGQVYVFDGKKGKTLHEIEAITESEQLGWSVASAGDWDSDGFSDLILGAPQGAEKKKRPRTGVARLYHGRKASILATFIGDEEGDRFGHAVHGAGDIDGNSFADVIVGSNTSMSYAVVYGGKKGEELYRFESEVEGNRFAWSVGGAGDVNGDSFVDLIIGIPGNLPEEGKGETDSRVIVYSGKDGTILLSMDGPSHGAHFGCSVSGAGDLNADSFVEVIVGMDGHGKRPGSARVFGMR